MFRSKTSSKKEKKKKQVAQNGLVEFRHQNERCVYVLLLCLMSYMFRYR